MNLKFLLRADGPATQVMKKAQFKLDIVFKFICLTFLFSQFLAINMCFAEKQPEHLQDGNATGVEAPPAHSVRAKDEQYKNANPTKYSETIRVLQPYWLTKQHGDPTGMIYVGDWDIFQNIFSPLVEMSSANTVRPALAERWTQSADGKRWVFYLRKNLHWSNGSPITTEQVVKSLERLAKGSKHTHFSSYVESIRALPDNQIEMLLKKTPKNFLTLLAFADSSILHPDAYKNKKFTWDVPSNGAYRISSFTDTAMELQANPYYWDYTAEKIKKVILTKAFGDPRDIDRLLSENLWDASTLDAGIVEKQEQVDALKRKYDVFTGPPDFLFCLYFSLKKVKTGRLSAQFRQYLFQQVYQKFWEQNKKHPYRASGLRFPGRKGSLTIAQFDEIFSKKKEISRKDHPEFPKTLEVIMSERHRAKPSSERLLKILSSLGFSVKDNFLTLSELDQKRNSGEFDLFLTYSGASEYDPDTVWRYYSPDLAEPVASIEELDQAQLESSDVKRNQMYQEFEKRAVERALFIPLKYENTYIVTSKRIVLDTTLAADWGLQLFKLKMR